MEYHNCVENTWFISAAENAGEGKGAQDFVEWLEQHPKFGPAFLDSIGGKDAINKNHIICLTKDGAPLTQAAKEWFRATYKNDIAAAGYIKENIKEPVKRRLEKTGEAIQSSDPKRRKEGKKEQKK